jgi:hypothetical protein
VWADGVSITSDGIGWFASSPTDSPHPAPPSPRFILALTVVGFGLIAVSWVLFIAALSIEGGLDEIFRATEWRSGAGLLLVTWVTGPSGLGLLLSAALTSKRGEGWTSTVARAAVWTALILGFIPAGIQILYVLEGLSSCVGC